MPIAAMRLMPCGGEHLVDLARRWPRCRRRGSSSYRLQRTFRQGWTTAREKDCRRPNRISRANPSRHRHGYRRCPFPAGGARSASLRWHKARPASLPPDPHAQRASSSESSGFALLSIMSSGTPFSSSATAASSGDCGLVLRHSLSVSSYPMSLAQALGCEIHHGDDPRIIQPRRPDNPHHADHLALSVAIGRGDHRRPGKREQTIFRADENARRTAHRAPLSARSATDCLFSRSSSRERTRSRSVSASSSSRLACPRTINTGRSSGILAPHRKAALHQIAAGRIERRAARGDLGAHRQRRFGKGSPRQPTRNVVGCFDQARRVADQVASSTIRFSTAPSSPTMHRKRPAVAKRHQLQLHQARLPARHHHHAGPG